MSIDSHNDSKQKTEDKRAHRIAGAPFNDLDADVVFTTSDGVDFHVYKIVLSIASPFFKNMFSLTQPPDVDARSTPIVIAETSETFDSLLRLCYPIDDPTVRALDLMEKLLEAVMKYQMVEATKICRSWLKGCVATAGALPVFAAACRLQLEDEARFAAESWRTSYKATQLRSSRSKSKNTTSNTTSSSTDFSSVLADQLYTPSIGALPASVYFRLLYFCHATTFASDSFKFLARGDPRRSWIFNKWGHPHSPSPDVKFDRAEADIILRSSDGEDFPYHTLLLRLASLDKLVDLSALPPSHRGTESTSNLELPVVHVPVRRQVLEDFLRICHPSIHYEFAEPRRLLAISQVAIQYEMTNIISTLRKQTDRLLADRPLAVYFIAMKNGWMKEAERAAGALVERKSIEEEYDPIMEDVPAAMYHSLLRYHHAGVSAIANIVRRHVPAACVAWQILSPFELSKPATASLALVERILPAGSSDTMKELCELNRTMEQAITTKLAEIKLILPQDEQSNSDDILSNIGDLYGCCDVLSA